MNSNGDNFTENDPMSETEFGERAERTGDRVKGKARELSESASEAWEQTRQNAAMAGERTQVFLRDNPVPTVLGALVLGIAIGLAIRYASRPSEPASIADNLRDVDLRGWSKPLLRKLKRGYEDSAEAVRDGIERVRDIEVDDYVKPLRKRWKKWVS